MRKGPFKVLSSKSVYKNSWIKVKEEKVIRPDGKKGLFGIIDYGSGVSVVALDKDKNIYLIKEYYYALEREGLQTPSGGIEPGETPLQAAKKELLEETGLIARKWTSLGVVDPLTMILKSPAHLFLATNIERQGKGEAGIDVLKIPFKDACKLVMDSEITHGPSCVAILKVKTHLESLL